MDGRAVFRWATNILTDTILDVLAASNFKPQDTDLYIPHQANIRIIRLEMFDICERVKPNVRDESPPD